MSELKPITWLGDSRSRLHEADKVTRQRAGQELQFLQRGKLPKDFRAMPDIGAGAMEIRVHGDNEYRVFYVARFEETVYVLHVFEKKTRKTRKGDLDLGRRRYRTMTEMRGAK